MQTVIAYEFFSFFFFFVDIYFDDLLILNALSEMYSKYNL